MLPTLVSAVAALVASVACIMLLRQMRAAQVTRLLLEQIQAGIRTEGETTRVALRAAEAPLAERLTALRGGLDLATEQLRTALAEGLLRTSGRTAEQFETVRQLLDAKLKELRDSNDLRLAEIHKTVNEQLHAAVEKQMGESFNRVIDQFTAVQKAMGDVQAVTAQIGDIRRLFSNVKTRGGWGETQVRAMLDDILPPGAYETNRRVRPNSDEAVEFAVIMPMRGEARPVLPIDAKFPVEDYERLLAASEAGDQEAERAASKALERRIRDEARKIATKYIVPPVTVEFAVLYLPTDALYAEVARIPGLIDEIGRDCRVLVMGPTLFPALLRTIHLGFVTLALEHKADQVRDLLGATRTEMLKMDEVLDRLGKQVGTVSSTIEKARVRTRAVGRKLRGVEKVEPDRAEALLELDMSASDLNLDGIDVDSED
ncbi:MAG TPA: DNA recombination protein RmuC [Rhodopila sp.]|nr:DNA recombination protein RmuC [Rhodopila sp.]